VFNTQSASVQCNTLIATATIAPPITAASTGSATIKVKGTLGGCTSTGATPSEPTIVSGSFTGTLSSSGGGSGCAGLLGSSSISGNLIIKWKAGAGQKLDFASTTLSGGSITGGVFNGPGSVAYGEFSLSGQSIQASSAFAGGTPQTASATLEDAGNLFAQCNGATGIKTIHLGVGNATA
jgi:hypothetical protein